MNDTSTMRPVSEENKIEGMRIELDKFNLGSNDLRTTENVDIAHPTSDKGPHLIEEDQPVTRVT